MDLKEKFKSLIGEGKLSHAYLFWGSNSEIQLRFALGLINYLENKDWDENNKNFKEAILVNGDAPEKSSIGIDEIRNLKGFLSQSPILSSRRCVLIYKAELMTPEAQNAILKIAEEPNSKVLIIFIANNVESLLFPLTSRMMKIFIHSKYDLDVSLSQSVKDFLAFKNSILIKELIENHKILDLFLNHLVVELRKDLNKNWIIIKEILHRQRIMKQFNTNKKLQLEAIVCKL